MNIFKKLEISKKGQLLIPKYYRELSGIKAGSRVALTAEQNKLIVSLLPEDPIDAACGFLKGAPSLSNELRKERHADSQKEKKKIRR
jgi:AbrB family looped-hinge helix DNA binding protein